MPGRLEAVGISWIATALSQGQTLSEVMETFVVALCFLRGNRRPLPHAADELAQGSCGRERGRNLCSPGETSAIRCLNTRFYFMCGAATVEGKVMDSTKRFPYLTTA
jgi:hypothetical protein